MLNVRLLGTTERISHYGQAGYSIHFGRVEMCGLVF
jgi:hypothetical protein